MNENLFADVIRLAIELDQATANLDPFNPSSLDDVRCVVTKLETLINDAVHSLGQVSEMITMAQALLDFADTTVGV